MRRATRVRLKEVSKNEVLSLNKLYGQRVGNDKDDVREGVEDQLSQVPRCQKKLMITLYLRYLYQYSNVF